MRSRQPFPAMGMLFLTANTLVAILGIHVISSTLTTNAFGLLATPPTIKTQRIRSVRVVERIMCSKLTVMMNDNENSIHASSSSTSPLQQSSLSSASPSASVESSSMSSASSVSTTAASTNEYSFFDEATIYVRAGSGGQGASTYKKGLGVNNHQNGPPDGGDGGRGGNVVLRLDSSLNTLAGLSRYAYRPNSFGGGGGAAIQKRKVGGGNGGGVGGGADAGRMLSFRAENGADGGRQNKRGRIGKDIVVRVPPGTIVQEERMSEDGDDGSVGNEQCHQVDIGTITFSNPTIIVASGGAGGEGSAVTSERHQRGTRRVRAPPRPGERMRLKLTLQVVADVALVAVPNAGKSTLLSKVTRAKPKIADYPFTTVVPNLGVWVPNNGNYDTTYDDDDYEDDYSIDENGNPISSNTRGGNNSLILCDVPGLIAGASEGVGLGHAFLRHVERCHVILHLLDATSKDVIEEYAMINRELLNYGTGKLAAMPQVVVVNKVDVAFASSTDADDDDNRCFRSKEELEAKLLEVMPHSRLMWISAKEEDGVDDLMERVAMFVRKVKGALAAEEDTAIVQNGS